MSLPRLRPFGHGQPPCQWSACWLLSAGCYLLSLSSTGLVSSPRPRP
ncbi:MAG: hypothetical protein MZV64_13680 [Ignavibacteriales bacterium]|nr:hypothetical protein [Ignavibacteriales bacterium]